MSCHVCFALPLLILLPLPHRHRHLYWLFLAAFLLLAPATASFPASSYTLAAVHVPPNGREPRQTPTFDDDERDVGLGSDARQHHPKEADAGPEPTRDKPTAALSNIRDALGVLQNSWFEVWLGTWPTAIDWTAAVINTHVTSSLATLSKAIRTDHQAGIQDRDLLENEINLYFSHTLAYYFGEDDFRVRLEAYDDMLWVVLGWLESVKFIDAHSNRHFNATRWHGLQWTEAFSHRAHIFYEITTRGWDTSLCGGGMVWNPHLGPYKNAITNELYIAASVGMYLYFPGDDNESPFVYDRLQSSGLSPAEPHERRFLTAAIEGYDWLKRIGMVNDKGLYVDGYHIHGWQSPLHPGTGKCDERSEEVFTYNQGVILSGLRGLWESTGNATYLTDGHQLVRNVITATGWSLDTSKSSGTRDWAGLGRAGILEDRCDPRGDCSQDSQTFKGIFFHHLTLFCEPLPKFSKIPGVSWGADESLAALHLHSCTGYTAWVAHNAHAALGTRDDKGRFGGWWGANTNEAVEAHEEKRPLDYHNERWSQQYQDPSSLEQSLSSRLRTMPTDRKQQNLRTTSDSHDPNDRGPGRTVETQSGGLALFICLWKLLNIS